MTYNLLDSVTLSSSASSVTFSSIDQSYGDLVLVISPKSLTPTGYGGAALIRFNSDSGSNYSYVFMYGNGSTASSSSGTTTNVYGGYQANNDNTPNFLANIMDYSATDKHKAVLTRHGQAENIVYARVYRWANTAAITSIDIASSGGDFAAGSTFYLYGVAA